MKRMAVQQPTMFASDAYGNPTTKGMVGRSDPSTSHDAAQHMVKSGKLTRHSQAVYQIIQRNPGKTYPELFLLSNKEERAILKNEAALQRRLSDLKERKLIRCVTDEEGNAVKVPCPVPAHAGNPMSIFEAIPSESQA